MSIIERYDQEISKNHSYCTTDVIPTKKPEGGDIQADHVEFQWSG